MNNTVPLTPAEAAELERMETRHTRPRALGVPSIRERWTAGDTITKAMHSCRSSTRLLQRWALLAGVEWPDGRKLPATRKRKAETTRAALAMPERRQDLLEHLARVRHKRMPGIRKRQHDPRFNRLALLTDQQRADYELMVKSKGVPTDEAMRIIGRPELTMAAHAATVHAQAMVEAEAERLAQRRAHLAQQDPESAYAFDMMRGATAIAARAASTKQDGDDALSIERERT